MDIKQYIASGIIETYVMGLCSAEEEREIESLREQYPELDEAINRYEEEMEKNMQEHITLPPAETDARILKTLGSLNVPVIPIGSSHNARNGYGWLRVAASVAIFLFAVSTVFNYILFDKTKKQALALEESQKTGPTLPSRDYNILNDPSITPVAMYGVGIHSICRCTMFWDKKTGKLYFMIHHLVPSGASKDFQLWAMVNGKPVNVGIVRDEVRGRFIELDNVPADAVAFMVTLEKAGGNDSPTMQEMYLKGNI